MKTLGNLLGALALVGLCACSTNTGTARVVDTSPAPAATSQPAAAPAQGRPVDCSTVRCAACPDGQTPALRPPDCCRCVPQRGGGQPTDCSNVRCAACPQGQHPALVPPDCCKCVPGMAEAALPF
jgi:hypothetical protein